MICPRCTVAEIAETGHCALCGFSPAAGVILQESVINEVQQVVQRATAERYRIQSLLRLGERSLVYLAHELAHDRLVALKVIPVREGVDEALARRFERQAALYQSLRQAHVVPLHAFGAAATFLWYTLDHVKGPSLGDLLRENGPLSIDLCLSIAEQIATALDHAHRRGVTHSNLKPSNVFIDDRWVRVSDFAILEAFGRQAAPGAGGPSLRLPEYLAPEQFYARTPPASADQYALAIIVYQCLTGTPPFIGDSFDEVARRQARETPAPLRELRKDTPVPMSEAVSRALSKQPAGRFPSVLDFVTLMNAVPTPTPRRPAPARRSKRASKAKPQPQVLLIEPAEPSRRRRWMLGLLAAVAVGAVATYAVRARGAEFWLSRIRLGPGPDPPAVFTPAPASPLPAPPPEERAPAPPSRDRAVPTVTGSPPAATPAPPAPLRAGTLHMNSTPWGQLYIDGVLIGNTPKASIPLSAGRHLIRITREGYEPFEQELVVQPGETVRLTGIVLRSRGL